MMFMDEEERYRINVFDWEREFPEVFKASGFDAVIGNPPYVRAESLGDTKNYLQSHYASYDGGADLYAYFMEKGIRLLRDNGMFGIIVSSSFLRTRFAVQLRYYLKSAAAVERIVDFGDLPVLENAKDTYVCIPIFRKGKQAISFNACHVKHLNLPDLQEFVESNSYAVTSGQLTSEAWSLKGQIESTLFAKIMQAGMPLGEYVEKKMFYGIKTGLNAAFEVNLEEYREIISK